MFKILAHRRSRCTTSSRFASGRAAHDYRGLGSPSLLDFMVVVVVLLVRSGSHSGIVEADATMREGSVQGAAQRLVR